MRIYFTTDGSIDQELQQVCPYGQVHHFTRFDGTEYTTPMNVGCGGCRECPYCYGMGFSGPYGTHPKTWVMMPKFIEFPNMGYEEVEQAKVELGTKQFRTVSLNDYVKCAHCYREEFRNKSKKLKFKIWWWHHCGIKLDELHYFLYKHYLDIKFKIMEPFRNFKYKLETRRSIDSKKEK